MTDLHLTRNATGSVTLGGERELTLAQTSALLDLLAGHDWLFATITPTGQITTAHAIYKQG